MTKTSSGLPAIHAEVFQTKAGTPYLKGPGVVMIARPAVDTSGLQGFLDGFDPKLNFGDYLKDPDQLPSGALLVKTAGQVCYASFGPKRTMNADAQKYIDNLASSGHGSVLEHPCYSFFIYGISRSVTHEIVRHRAGVAYSQLSQRYVSGRVLRFVERPEYQVVPNLHRRFEDRIDVAAEDYGAISEHLAGLQEAGDTAILTADAKTDLRKKVQQTARSILPNETETTMVMTGNIRAWRHIMEMRANEHAETEIRRPFFNIFRCLRELEPQLFNDYEEVEFSDGTHGIKTSWRKV